MSGGISFSTYFLLSASLTAIVVSYAFQTYIQFYPSIIYLVTSKFSMLVLGNMGLGLTLFLGRVFKTLFFGQLRDVEVEILYDNARYAITETCLALTIFREELNTRVLTLFTALLFSKSFHWLCQSRVEYVESDNVSRWTHVRLMTLMLSLLIVDITYVTTCILLWKGPSVLILFGFEYTILAVSVLSTFIRYCLHIIDMNIEGNWPQKGSYLFFLEFVTEVVRFLSYVVFFTIIFTYYGMPLHIVRDLWMSYINLKRRLIIFNKYRKLTANMNERFPNATPEELDACEHTCIICRDSMDVGKKLPCSHIFHLDCLRLWLQQQQSCPTCRAEIPTEPPPSTPPTNPAAAAAPQRPIGLGPAPAFNQPLHQPQPGPQENATVRAQGGHPVLPQGAERGYPGQVGSQQPQQRQGSAAATSTPYTNPPRNVLPHPPYVPNVMNVEPTTAGLAAEPPPHPVHRPTARSYSYFPVPVDHPHHPHAAPPMPPFSFPPAHPFFMMPPPPPPWMMPPPLLLPPFPPPPPYYGSFASSEDSNDSFNSPFTIYRVMPAEGATIRTHQDLSSPVLRTLQQNETVLITERTEQTDGSITYRVLGGGYIIDKRGGADDDEGAGGKNHQGYGRQELLLEALGGGPLSRFNQSERAEPVSSSRRLSRNLVSLQLDLAEARTGLNALNEGLGILLERQEAEVRRMQNVLAGLERAYAASSSQVGESQQGSRSDDVTASSSS